NASWTGGRRTGSGRFAAQDVFQVADPAYRELVGADLFVAVAGVEALGAMVAGPDPDPQGAWAVAQQPAFGLGEDPRAPAAALVRGQHVQPLQLAVAGLHFRMRQPAGT